jgi:hypothetical protein
MVFKINEPVKWLRKFGNLDWEKTKHHLLFKVARTKDHAELEAK